MEILDCIQGSPDWVKARLGMVTASKFSDVMSKGAGKTRKDYMLDLATEIMEGTQTVGYFDKNMEAGQDKETQAREYYQLISGCTVKEVGFIKMNDIVGASPDGMIGEDGLLEIKCPLGKTHTRYILEDRIPTAYKAQIQGQLYVTERRWCDFLSYRPENKQRPHFIKRVYRDEAYIKDMSIQVIMFVAELKKLIETLTRSEF